MPVNLTSYVGNANLGQSNANIPVIEKDTDLNVLNKADENAMLLNHENNVRLFQQKVSDRAYLQNLINEGKVESGDIDDKDRPAYDAAEKDATDAYKAIKGVNDTQGLENYRQKVLALQNVTKAAQGRWVAIKQQEQDIANEPLPSKQKAMQSHLDAETKTPVYNQITPYQKALDLNIPDMDAQSFSGVSGTGLSPSLPTTKIATTNNGGKIKQTVIQQAGKGGQTGTTGLVKGQSIIGQPASTDNTTTGTTDNTSGTQVSPSGKLSPISVTPTTIFDYDKLRDNNARLYSDNEEHRLNQDMFVSGIESGKIGDTKEIIDYANDKINQYNQISGKQVKPFVEGVDYIRNPQTGQVKFNLPTSEVVSKLQLAKLGQFKTGGQEVFNKDVGDYLAKLGEIQNGRDKNAIAARRANAYVRLTNKKADEMDEDEKQVKSFFGNMIDNLGTSYSNNKFGFVVYAGSLPKAFRNIGGIKYDTTEKKYIPAVVNPIQSSGNVKEYWQPRIINNESGEEETYDDLKKIAEQQYGRTLSADETVAKIKYLLKHSNAYSMEVIGANGESANAQSALQSAKLINNATKKKGDSGTLEQPEPEQ